MNLRRRDVINLSCLFLEWTIIFSLILLNLQYSNPILKMISIILIGTRIHALGILMHEAAHFGLLRYRKWNDLVTKVFITLPAFVSLDSYRLSHMKHHQNNLTDDDPTFVRKLGKEIFNFPKKSGWYLFRDLIFIMCGYGIYLSISDLKRNRTKNTNYEKWVCVVTILGLIFYFHIESTIFQYWVIPIFLVLPVLNFWRTVAEHSALQNVEEPTRTTIYHPFLAWLISPYNVNYHLEHHLHPKSPWYELKGLQSQTCIGRTTRGFKALWKELSTP